MLVSSVKMYYIYLNARKGLVSDGLICVIAVSQIFPLHQAIKIFNNCAVGLYSSMPFLNPHCKNSCPRVG